MGTSTKRHDEETFLEVFPLTKWISELRSFWRTRAAVLKGERLYAMDKEELRNRGLMSPWGFNLLESILVSVPGMVFAGWNKLFLRADGPQPQPVSDLERVSSILGEVLLPALPPFILFVTALFVARVSLRPLHSSTANRRVATRVYLYADGAHGLLAEFSYSMTLTLGQGGFLGDAYTWVFLVVSTWVTSEVFGPIKSELFAYDDSLQKSREFFAAFYNESRWSRYLIGMLFILPLVIVVTSVLFIAGVVVLAGLFVLVRSLGPSPS